MAITIPLCPDLQAFMDVLDMAIDYTMQHEVRDLVNSTIISFVYERVYKQYTPHVYIRWREQGGLSDVNNLNATYDVQTKTLTVQDVRDDPDTVEWRWKKSGDPDMTVADIVEKGGPYSWRVRIKPRPFHQPAEDYLVRGGFIDRALTNSLAANLGGWSY